MTSTTPLQRGRELNKHLSRLYEPGQHAENVVDMLTDLRHLCDAYDLDFDECNRMAYDHYLAEREQKTVYTL